MSKLLTGREIRRLNVPMRHGNCYGPGSMSIVHAHAVGHRATYLFQPSPSNRADLRVRGMVLVGDGTRFSNVYDRSAHVGITLGFTHPKLSKFTNAHAGLICIKSSRTKQVLIPNINLICSPKHTGQPKTLDAPKGIACWGGANRKLTEF